MLQAYLTMFGHEVRGAPDGLEALRIARQFQPDVIFMDIWMPLMDGFEACQRLRHDAMTRETAVYALSAGSTAELQGAHCFDAFLSKPVELDAVADLVIHPRHLHH